MKNKKVFLILGLIFLGDILRKIVLRIFSPIPSGEYSADIYSLIIELILITILGTFIKQRNWRVLCLIVGIDDIIMHLAPLSPRNLNLILYIFSALLAAVGFINLKYFYRSEFEMPKSRSPLLSALPLVLFLLIIFIIFLFYGKR